MWALSTLICSSHFVKCLQCNVRCAVQSHFPPVQKVLILIVSNMMELTIDEALPQPLLPRVDGQVVEAKLGALILACIFDNQGQSNWSWFSFFMMAISLMSIEVKSLEPWYSPAPELLLSSNSKGVPGGKDMMMIKVLPMKTWWWLRSKQLSWLEWCSWWWSLIGDNDNNDDDQDHSK